MKLIKPSKILLYVTVMVFALGMVFMEKPNQSQTLSVCIMLGIDKTEDEVFITSRSIVAGQAQERTPSEVILESKGDNIAEAIDNMSLHIGKTIGLAHCNIIALGDSVIADDIQSITDYFVRTKKIGKNAILISCGESAREFLQAASYVTNNMGRKIQDIVSFNEKANKATQSSIDDFYKGYYSAPAASLLTKMYLSTRQTSGLSATVADEIINATAPNAKAEEGKIKYLVNDGSAVILKKGKLVYTLKPSQTRLLNYFMNGSKIGLVKVEGINDKNFSQATLMLNVLSTKSKLKASWKEDKPHFALELNLAISLEEIVKNESSNKKIEPLQTIISKEIREVLKNNLERELKEFFKEMQAVNTDILKVYQKFLETNPKRLKEYLSKLESEDEYLGGIEFTPKVSVSVSI